MKKGILVALLLSLCFVLCLVLAACGATKDETDEGETTKTSQATNTSGDTIGTDESKPDTDGDTSDKNNETINPSEGLGFLLSEDKTYYIVIGMGTCTDTEIVIPSTYKDLPVAKIGSSAFFDCESLSSVTISNSVTSIDDHAFCGCKGIESVLFDKDGQLTSIGDGAFSGCKALTSIEIPRGVLSIGERVFSDCSNLTSIVFEEGSQLTSIGNSAFDDCRSLKSIKIPSNVINLSKKTFGGWENITSITVDGGNEKFMSIDGNLYTKDGKTLIKYASGEDRAFIIPDGVTNIGEYAFDYCTKLTMVTIPGSVTSIGRNAFEDCTSLVIYCMAEEQPSGWDSDWNPINRPVVWDCNNNDIANDGYIYAVFDGVQYALSDEAMVVGQVENRGAVIVPESITYKETSYPVTSVGEGAFENCTSLISITIPFVGTTLNGTGNIFSDSFGYIFEDLGGIGEYTIPTSLKEVIITGGNSIGSGAFGGCTGLTKIVIPNSVTSIGGLAFFDCTNLTIYCEAESQPSGWSSDWNPSSCPVVWGYKQEG